VTTESIARGVRNELEQRSVRVAEVDALPAAPRSGPLDGARLDGDAAGEEVLDGSLDRALPHEAEVAVPGAHGLARDEVADVGRRAVDVQALVAERVGDAVLPKRNDLRAEDVAVEGVRPLPVRDRDDDVVEPQAGGQGSRSQ
jgi:hypothetical protein